ncbi:MAG TPA: helix-turn-helix domain-containing protein [Bradyrhizobium sp.]|nr:helix-turn-helix domain-containing protein [Bradyrhizobium sp.]
MAEELEAWRLLGRLDDLGERRALAVEARFGVSHGQSILLARLLHGPSVVSRQALFNAGHDHTKEDIDLKVIDAQLCKLRATLSDQGFPDLIQTVRGRGFRLAPDLRGRLLSELGE